MKMQANWKPVEVSPIYWLTLWGNTHKDIIDLVSPMLPNRTRDGVSTMCGEVRRQLSIIKGFEVGQKPSSNIPDLVRKASQIEPIRDIASLKPANLADVIFIPSKIRPHKPAKVYAPKFTQVEANPPKDLSYIESSIFVKNTDEQKQKISKFVDQASLPKVGNFAGKAISSLKEPDIEQRVFGIDSTEELIKDIDEGRGHFREPSLEDVLKAAKAAGASKVCYKDYTIKFS